MSPAMYPCSNPFCPHDGFTTRAGDMCDECKKRAGVVDRLLDRLETDEQKQKRREKRKRDNQHRKDGEG